ncbi:MAG: hypothetical protein RRY08_00390 [Christensenella sp.]
MGDLTGAPLPKAVGMKNMGGGDLPDFGSMSKEELAAFISEAERGA